jgi:hypothetical protein
MTFSAMLSDVVLHPSVRSTCDSLSRRQSARASSSNTASSIDAMTVGGVDIPADHDSVRRFVDSYAFEDGIGQFDAEDVVLGRLEAQESLPDWQARQSGSAPRRARAIGRSARPCEKRDSGSVGYEEDPVGDRERPVDGGESRK